MIAIDLVSLWTAKPLQPLPDGQWQICFCEDLSCGALLCCTKPTECYQPGCSAVPTDAGEDLQWWKPVHCRLSTWQTPDLRPRRTDWLRYLRRPACGQWSNCAVRNRSHRLTIVGKDLKTTNANNKSYNLSTITIVQNNKSWENCIGNNRKILKSTILLQIPHHTGMLIYLF